jgi:hypothetical protein
MVLAQTPTGWRSGRLQGWLQPAADGQRGGDPSYLEATMIPRNDTLQPELSPSFDPAPRAAISPTR